MSRRLRSYTPTAARHFVTNGKVQWTACGRTWSPGLRPATERPDQVTCKNCIRVLKRQAEEAAVRGTGQPHPDVAPMVQTARAMRDEQNRRRGRA